MYKFALSMLSIKVSDINSWPLVYITVWQDLGFRVMLIWLLGLNPKMFICECGFIFPEHAG